VDRLPFNVYSFLFSPVEKFFQQRGLPWSPSIGVEESLLNGQEQGHGEIDIKGILTETFKFLGIVIIPSPDLDKIP
jgi:hypothetical protein